MGMLKHLLVKNDIAPVSEYPAELHAYDQKMFERWSLLRLFFYKDLHTYILKFAMNLEEKGFWGEINTIFNSTKYSKCDSDSKKWDNDTKLRFLLCISNPNWVAMCPNKCCFSFERTFVFVEAQCWLSLSETKEWKEAFEKIECNKNIGLLALLKFNQR